MLNTTSHNTTFALTLLALFTSSDKAAEIEGDLLEQSRSNGRLWFWWQVKLTCLMLFVHGVRAETAKLLLFSYAIYELVQKFNWWVLNPMRRSFRRSLDLNVADMALTNNVIDVLFAFWIGMMLTRLSPKHGGQIILLVCGMVIARETLMTGIADAAEFIVYTLIALLGALVMKWQELRYGGWKCERTA